MEIFTVKEFQDNWDELMERVEKGEHLGIVMMMDMQQS